MYDLTRFGFNEMMRCRGELRTMFDRSPETLGEAGDRIVHYFHSQFVDDKGRSAFALARLFKTHPFWDLDDDLQRFARAIAPEADRIPNLRCLVMLATAGDMPFWNSRHESRGHKAIPLVSEQLVEKAPMISQLIKQFGVSVSTVLQPDPSLLLDASQKSDSVFYIPQAAGSPYIVAQEEFVSRYKIASVVGFGGMLTSGDLFATILFSKILISPDIADTFKVLGLNLKLAILPLARKPLFRRT
ncbi:MAG TPA: hypothetical protein VHL58_02350 [Thermoanaerobaculia bacterium]|nr:hypothetical protein [Thermoanaerobaculia bacterium]